MEQKKEQLVERDSPVLREVAKAVPIKDIKTPRIKKIIAQMQEAMHGESDGVAIAAPQIGVGLRIFVVNGEALHKIEHPHDDTEREEKEDMIFINPEITRLSRQKEEKEEGCLSLRYLYGRVLRSEKASIKAYNENGERFTRGASGLLAQIFQHEVDHLNGILFIDKAEGVRNIPPSNE